MSTDGSKANIIRLFNVSKRYGGKLALDDITLDIDPGEFIIVSGPSGAGKSTLLKVNVSGGKGIRRPDSH